MLKRSLYQLRCDRQQSAYYTGEVSLFIRDFKLDADGSKSLRIKEAVTALKFLKILFGLNPRRFLSISIKLQIF